MRRAKSILIMMMVSMLVVTGIPDVLGEGMDKIVEVEETEVEPEIVEETEVEPEIVEETEVIEEIEESVAEIIAEIPLDETRAGTFKPEILAGRTFSIARLSDGTWWSWGANNEGQLGLGDHNNRLHPVKINSPELEKGIVKKARVIKNSVVIQMSDNKVYSWGFAISNIGGGPTPKYRFTADSFGFSWNDNAAVNHSSMGVLRNGQVNVVGSGFYSQFGRGLNSYGSNEYGNSGFNRRLGTETSYPALISAVHEFHPNNPAGQSYKRVKSGVPLSNVKLVDGATDTFRYVTVDSKNDIYYWGNRWNLLATKHSNNKIEGNIIDIRYGIKGYALTDRGEVWTWEGANGETIKLPISNVKSISVYNTNVSFITHSGDLYLRGSNAYGAVPGEDIYTIVKVASNVVAADTGTRHTVWMTSDGKVWGMGWNQYRQLAVAKDGVLETFTKIPTLKGVSNIAATTNSSYATIGKDLYAWGEQAGDLGSTRNTPGKVKTFDSNIATMTGSSADDYRTLSFLLENKDTYVVGNNYQYNMGHLGASNKITKQVHVPNSLSTKKTVANGISYQRPVETSINGANIKPKAMMQGINGGTLVDHDGQLLTWGYSTLWGFDTLDQYVWSGGRVEPKSTESFRRVSPGKKFKAVSGTGWVHLALSEDGKVYSRGREADELGRAGNAYLNLEIPELKNITHVDMNYRTGIAIDTSGDIFTWGYNVAGQLGNGSVTDSRTPRKITESIDEKFVKGFSGYASSFAITDKGELYAWGNNRYGQLGLGDRVNRTSPRKVEGLPGKVKSIAGGLEHTLILLENGDVYVAGGDATGQQGLGPTRSISGKVEIPFPDYITINNADNQSIDMNSTYTLSGDILSLVDGHKLALTYEIESVSGIVESGSIGTYTSSRKGVSFSKSIPIDKKYTLGGYTLNLKVMNNSTKLANEASVNFEVVDRIKPTAPKIDINQYWEKSKQIMTITPGTDADSGVDKTQWRYVDGEWADYVTPVTLVKEGNHKIEARTIDKAGNTSLSNSQSRIDNTSPKLSVHGNFTDITHEDLILTIDTSDGGSGLDYITLDGERLEAGVREVTITKNGRYTFESYDKVGNRSYEKVSVSKIDKSLSFIKPDLSPIQDIQLSETDVVSKFSPLTIKDWREVQTPWTLSISATPLASESNILREGTLNIGHSMIDGGAHRILMQNPRGVSQKSIDDLIIKFNLSDTKQGQYKSIITWDIVQAP